MACEIMNMGLRWEWGLGGLSPRLILQCRLGVWSRRLGLLLCVYFWGTLMRTMGVARGLTGLGD